MQSSEEFLRLHFPLNYSMKRMSLQHRPNFLSKTDDAHWPEQTVSVGPRGRMCGRVESELDTVRLLTLSIETGSNGRARWYQWIFLEQRGLPLLSSTGQRRVQKLRCGWLSQSAGVSGKIRTEWLRCSPNNGRRNCGSHFPMPVSRRHLAMQDRRRNVQVPGWKTSAVDHRSALVRWRGLKTGDPRRQT
jgi:hypothetical protein